MKQKLSDVIGVDSSMTTDEVVKQCNLHKDLVQQYMPNLGDTLVAISDAQKAVTLALMAYEAANTALQVAKKLLGIGDIPTDPIVTASKLVSKATDQLITSIDNIEIEV